jgi:hypothetical protein
VCFSLVGRFMFGRAAADCIGQYWRHSSIPTRGHAVMRQGQQKSECWKTASVALQTRLSTVTEG